MDVKLVITFQETDLLHHPAPAHMGKGQIACFTTTWATYTGLGDGHCLLDISLFRFTSELEFCFEAWGAHADRYDRATDQKQFIDP